MIAIVSAAIAPGLALLSYFYLRDEYESEPIRAVFRAFILGVMITFPVMFIQYVLQEESVLTSLYIQSFVSYGFLEEYVKWFVLYFFVYHLTEFDEPYDGIVYGVAVSLGFATLENILYLAVHGLEAAFGRAMLPVSSHALFGVVMGYYMGKAKFSPPDRRKQLLAVSLLFPVLLHGLYDYILVSSKDWLYLMIPFMLFLWWLGLWKVKKAHRLTHEHHSIQTKEKHGSHM